MIRRIKRFARRLYLNRVRPPLLRVCAGHPVLASVYYVVDPSFRREHRSVLAGKLGHIRSQSGAAEAGRFTLRRNTHRLEKGLIMRPRRDVFARDYVLETARLYAESVAGSNGAVAPGRGGPGRLWGVDDRASELNCWAGDVLHRYFDAVKEGLDERVDEARAIFRGAHAERPYVAGDAAPFVRETGASGVTIEGLEALAQHRRSVRWYEDRRVPREMLDRAVRVAVEAPSACNRQPFEFRIFDEPELARKIGSIPMGTRGFSENFPCVIVVVGKLRAFPFERDRHVPYIDASLATMGLLYAIEAQGLASCCINWPEIEGRERAMERAIGLARDERVVMCISVGFPLREGLVPYSQKQTLNELRSYNVIHGEVFGGSGEGVAPVEVEPVSADESSAYS